MVGTPLSWVYHHWSQTKALGGLKPRLDPELVWNNLGELWPASLNEGHEFTIFGARTLSNGVTIPLERVRQLTVAHL